MITINKTNVPAKKIVDFWQNCTVLSAKGIAACITIMHASLSQPSREPRQLMEYQDQTLMIGFYWWLQVTFDSTALGPWRLLLSLLRSCARQILALGGFPRQYYSSECGQTTQPSYFYGLCADEDVPNRVRVSGIILMMCLSCLCKKSSYYYWIPT